MDLYLIIGISNLLIIFPSDAVGNELLPHSTVPENKDDVKNFIEKYMYNPVTIIHDFIDDDSVLRVNFSKTLLKYNLETFKTYSIRLERHCAYILITKDFNSLNMSLNRLTNMRGWNNNQAYLILFRKLVTERHIQQGFSLLFGYNIFNVVIYKKGGQFYTWYPYDKKSKCGTKVNIVKVGGQNPFENKIPKTVHGCSINITWNEASIFLMDPFNKTRPGALVLFINTLASKMKVNFTFLRNNTNIYASYLENYSFAPVLEDMKRRKIDMVLYGAVDGTAIHSMDNTARIHQGLCYLLLPSRNIVVHKNYIVNIYQTRLLLYIILVMVISGVLWRILTGSSLTDTALFTLQLALQLSTNRVPFKTRARVFFLALLLFLVCLNATYYTELSSVLTRPGYEPKIRTLEKFILHSTIKISAYYMSVKAMNLNSKLMRILKERWYVIPGSVSVLDILESFQRNNTEAITITEFYLHYFKNPEKLEVMYQDPLYSLVYLGTLRKGFPLKDTINYWIDNIKEKGFMYKYIRESTRTLSKSVAPDSDITKIPLNLTHLEGAFVILIAGLLISSVVFLCEIFFSKRKWCRN